MPTVESIMSRGYFPRELPPAFLTASLGQLLENRSSLPQGFTQPSAMPSKLVVHNLARSGTLRRQLGIPNPVHFYQLVFLIISNWSSLFAFTSRSHLSLTKPVDCRTGRAIDRQFDLHERAIKRTLIRSTARYILNADISRFYHSIYTHSIPWALHSKATAKADRSNRLLGNNLDRLVRNAQDQQTMGIPIGPDTSLLIAEIILTAVDNELASVGLANGFRYIDDYEFGFTTMAEAENAISALQNSLHKYELALNPQKTKIQTLPLPTEHPAISELRVFNFRSSPVGQLSDLVRFFDRAFTYSKDSPEECVLRYAVSRLSGVTFHPLTFTIIENLLLQTAMIEPGAIRLVLNQLLRLRLWGHPLNRNQIAQAFNYLIQQHAPQGHGSEVAWAIWGLIVLKLPLEDQSANASIIMDDSIVAILLLDARRKALVSRSVDISHLRSFMTTSDLYGDQWLLTYEANVKGWFRSRRGADHVAADSSFAFLKNNRIHFYDATLSDRLSYVPPAGLAQLTRAVTY